jgi:pyrroline-5-carboxylate reductase
MKNKVLGIVGLGNVAKIALLTEALYRKNPQDIIMVEPEKKEPEKSLVKGEKATFFLDELERLNKELSKDG